MSYYIKCLKLYLAPSAAFCLLFQAKYVPMGPWGTWTLEPSPQSVCPLQAFPPFSSVPLHAWSLRLPATPRSVGHCRVRCSSVFSAPISTHHGTLGSRGSGAATRPTTFHGPMWAQSGHTRKQTTCVGTNIQGTSRARQVLKSKLLGERTNKWWGKEEFLDAWSRGHGVSDEADLSPQISHLMMTALSTCHELADTSRSIAFS